MRAPLHSHGFTLLELLLVISLLALLFGASSIAISRIQDERQLSRAAWMIQGQLTSARQQAISTNRPVVVSFGQTTDEQGQTRWSLLQLSQLDRTGVEQPLTAMFRLPPAISLSDASDWSTLASLPAGTMNDRGQSVSSRRITFLPSGYADLDRGELWYFTLFNHVRSTAPGDSFIALGLDPVTGHIFWNQP